MKDTAFSHKNYAKKNARQGTGKVLLEPQSLHSSLSLSKKTPKVKKDLIHPIYFSIFPQARTHAFSLQLSQAL